MCKYMYVYKYIYIYINYILIAHLYMRKRGRKRELALTEKAKICSSIHQAGMTDTDKASCRVNKKQLFFPWSLCNFRVL